jgi:hypothetical protein
MRSLVALSPPPKEQERTMQQRRRFKQTMSLTERLDQEATRLRRQAETLPRGTEREKLVLKARQLEMASRVDEWLSLPGIQARTEAAPKVSKSTSLSGTRA